MNTIPWRVWRGLIVAGYAGAIAFSAMLIVKRYLAEQSDPDMFSGGMGAGGDWILELFIVGLLLIPTFLLALLIRDSEAAYTKFAKVLLGFGLAAPASLIVMAIPAVGQTNSMLGAVCLYRVFAFPMSVIGLAGFCVMAKFKRPRRLILYSILTEIVAVVAMVVLSK